MQCNSITPMCWSPLGNFFKTDNDQNARIKMEANKLSVKYDVAQEAILLAWIVKHPANILPVFGTTDPLKISQLMKATTIQLQTKEWFALWEASRGEQVA